MNISQPAFNLYEELPEPIFQDMKEKEAEDEKKKIADMVNAYFIILKNQDK